MPTHPIPRRVVPLSERSARRQLSWPERPSPAQSPSSPRSGHPPVRGSAWAQRRRPGVVRKLRTALATLSALVLLVTGYAWSVYRQLDGSLVISDVLAGPRSPDGATDILLVGLDSRTDGRGSPLPQQVLDQLNAGEDTGSVNTDTLILIRIPQDSAKISTAISIPRDSYVDIPGYGTHKINSAYARAANTERARLAARGIAGAELDRQASQAGRRNLVATVEALTGSSIDHYAEVNLAGFAEITQAVGGVPVCLNAAVRDSYSGADFAAGPQTLQGPPALAFVRQRHGLPRGDLDRIVRQQAFLASLAHKILSAGTLANPSALSGLISAVSRYVVLDQGWDLLGFAAQAQGLTGGNIEFRTVPTGTLALRTPSDGVAVQVNPALIRAFVTGLSDEAPTPPDQAGVAPVIADVSNATGRTGLATAVQDLLDNHGIVPGALGNAPSSARSVIRAAAATHAGAEQIAQLLGQLPVQRDDTIPLGHVQVLLGRDYHGPDPADATTTQAALGPRATPAPGDAPPGASPGDTPPITANGAPCVN